MKPMISDKILRDAVIKELESDPEVIEKYISVTAIDGAITLGGHVMAIHEKHVAVRAAERVPAVRAVADDISQGALSTRARRRQDRRSDRASASRTYTDPDSVGAQVRGGRVILHGQVHSTSQREAAESSVRRLTGVRVADNLITVKPRTASRFTRTHLTVVVAMLKKAPDRSNASERGTGSMTADKKEGTR